jgi:hypothetical protein
MHCEFCGELFQYREQIVALREEAGQVIAGYTIEGEGGAVAETFEAVGKYHVSCYRGCERTSLIGGGRDHHSTLKGLPRQGRRQVLM